MGKVLFLTQGGYPPAFYRGFLPARELDWDWAGVLKDGNELIHITGNIEAIDYTSYDVIIVQQPSGNDWLKIIEKWQSYGIKVLYEIDDFVHGIYRIKDHMNRRNFDKKHNKKFNICMKQADGIICSTEFLAEQYKKYNENVFVCQNYLDTDRYDIEVPNRGDYVTIGWAGGTGHQQAFAKWVVALDNVLFSYSNVNFMSVGEPYGDILATKYGPGRCTSMGWTSIENVPYYLANFDIVLAPSHDSNYFKSKSDLRWLEAGAVGLPVVADPLTYKDVESGKTGFVLSDSEEVEDTLYDLIEDRDLRLEIGSNAKNYIRENRDISVGAASWESAVSTILE